MVEGHTGDNYHEARILKGAFQRCCPSSKNLRGYMPFWALALSRTREAKTRFPPREFITTSPQIHGFVAGIHTICVAPNTPNQKFGLNWSWTGSALRQSGKYSLKHSLKKYF